MINLIYGGTDPSFESPLLQGLSTGHIGLIPTRIIRRRSALGSRCGRWSGAPRSDCSSKRSAPTRRRRNWPASRRGRSSGRPMSSAASWRRRPASSSPPTPIPPIPSASASIASWTPFSPSSSAAARSIGGRIYLLGAVLGAVVIQALTTSILTSGLPPEYNLVVKAAVVLVVLLLQSALLAGGCCRKASTGSEAMSEKYLPLLADDRRLRRAVRRRRRALQPFPVDAGARRHPRRQRLSHHRRHRRDLRHPVGRHRPVDRLDDRLRRRRHGQARSARLASARLGGGDARLSALGFGALQGLVIDFCEIQPFIVTLAGLFLLRGACFMVTLDSLPLRHPFVSDFAAAALPLPGGGFLASSALAMFAALADRARHRAHHLVRRQRLCDGRRSGLGGADGRADPRARRSRVYALGGLYSAFGGVIYALYTSSGYPLAGSGNELTAIAAVVLGGTVLTGGIGLVVGDAVRRHDPGLDRDADQFQRLAQRRLDHDQRRSAAVRVHCHAARLALFVQAEGRRLRFARGPWRGFPHT